MYLLKNNRQWAEDAKGECSNTEFDFQSRQQNQTLYHTRILCNQNRKSTVLVMYCWQPNKKRSVSRYAPDKNVF